MGESEQVSIQPQGASATAVVIGGGVIGLFTAWRLHEAGFAVTVIERGRAGASASWAGGGILSPLYPWRVPPEVWQLAAQSMARYPAICAQLAADTGIDCEWTPSGMAVLDEGEHPVAAAWAASAGSTVQQCLIRWAPGQERSGLWLPWVAQLRNPRLCRALAQQLRQLGVDLREDAGVVSLEIQGARARIAGESRVPDVLVVCAGAWSNTLLAPLQWPQPIRPVRGQMLMFRAAPGLLSKIVLDGSRYLIPRRDGRILAGSTVEETGFDDGTTQAAAEELRAFAIGLLPDLAAVPIENHWAGLRPGTPEGVPLIARHLQLSNLYVNAGHHRNGLTLAPASAEQLVAGLRG